MNPARSADKKPPSVSSATGSAAAVAKFQAMSAGSASRIANQFMNRMAKPIRARKTNTPHQPTNMKPATRSRCRNAVGSPAQGSDCPDRTRLRIAAVTQVA